MIIAMRISTFFYTIKQGLKNIWKNKMFSLASIATMTACIFLFGLFYTIVTNFQSMVKDAESGVAVTVFFDEGISQDKIDEIGDLIRARAEVSDLEFVSADDAWDSFKQTYFEGNEAAAESFAHTILRGGVNKFGQTQPNYHYEELVRLAELYNQWNLKNPAVIVDVNHSNSGKQYKEQIRIVSEVLHSRNYNSDLKKLVKGVMIESYLLEGRQDISDHMIPGCSITDPCLGWEDTEKLIYEIAEKC